SVHVFEKIENDRKIATLARETCSTAARRDRGAEFTADRECFVNVLFVARNDDANRSLSIIRAVGGVKRAVAIVETHFAFDFPTEFLRERFGFDIAGPFATAGCGRRCGSVGFHFTLAEGRLRDEWNARWPRAEW